jgi:hypothetical protein
MSDTTNTGVLPADVIQSVAIGNLKALAEQPAMLSNLVYSNLVANTNLSQQNAIACQQAMNEFGIAVTGKAVSLISNLGPAEARSAVDVLSNNQLAQAIADLKAMLQASPSLQGGQCFQPNQGGQFTQPQQFNQPQQY